MEHSNLQKSEKGNVNLASRTLKFLQIKSEQTDPLLHYSYESTICSLALPFLLIVVCSPSRESEQGRPSELTAPAVGGHAGVGEVAVEHQGADAPAWGCSTRLEAARSGLATETSDCCGCCSGGSASRRLADRRKAWEGAHGLPAAGHGCRRLQEKERRR